ncbi:MAG: oxidoreductase [Verrucomicrobia bacterium]|nr:MAG: oxidoreductase [Verrucomicrobiota bacterium]
MNPTVKPLIVITGASAGIGKATAELFGKQGHSLLLLARRTETMEALGLPNTLCRSIDVRDRNQLVEAVRAAEEKFGPVDAIVNNAGVLFLDELAKQDPGEWDKMIDINIKGLLNGIHAVASGMIQRRRGTIFNVSSISGKKTFPKYAVYTATKFAVHGLSENLREELSAHNVRVITIAPGAVETELLSRAADDAIKKGYQEWKKEVSDVLVAEDVANAISYAYNQPQNVCVREIVLSATRQKV